MIVRRAMKNSTVVPGGGAIDVCMVFLELKLDLGELSLYFGDSKCCFLGGRWR
jgi:hypothetical protein